MNAISCLARGKKKKRKRNCFALIARFARERGRERQKGKKKMQGRRSDVCVQQVAISNYRIILILGFRGGWVNRRRDLRFHAYLRRSSSSSGSSAWWGEGKGRGGRHYRRNALHLHAYPAFHELDRASFTIFILSFRSCFFLLLFLSRLWMRNGEGKPRQTGSPFSYRLRKPRFYSCSSSLFALLSFFLSFC